jgi:type IV pilus assembly protein PilQ
MLSKFLVKEKQPLKKSIHCYITKKAIQALALTMSIYLCGSYSAQAQESSQVAPALQSKLFALADSVPGLNQSANFSVVDTPIQELLRAVAKVHNLNINIDPLIEARVTNNFSDVPVKNLLLFLCETYGLDIRFSNTIMSFVRRKVVASTVAYTPKQLKISYASASDRLSVDLASDSVALFAKQLTQASGKNVILAPGINAKLLTGFISEMPFEKALDKIAYANNLVSTKVEEGVYILSNADAPSEGQTSGNTLTARGRNTKPKKLANSDGVIDLYIHGKDTMLTIEVLNTPIADIIKQASAIARKNYVFFSEPQGNTTTSLNKISYDALLTYLLQGTTHSFKKHDNIYLVGERNLEGFRTTTLIKLQFRSIQDIEKLIPADLLKGVDLKVFKELNALILSGGTPQVLEIHEFIKAIDQPVLNILIEVVVVEVRKGAGVRTGISAGIGDSTVKSRGQLFPGIDFTLSSKSVNDVIEKIDPRGGIFNLGKVAPNFYMSLEAMEENNQLDIQSTPKLSTLNGHEANLSIGQSRYYLEQTQNITGGVTPINSIAQRWNKVEANLAIKIQPSVAGDEHITLHIDAEFSDFVEPTIKGAPPGNATRKFVSEIRVRNEEMIVLGGLEEARKQNSGSGVPLLSRIPGLKWLFSSRSTSKSDSRLIIFIRPTIVY